jgi:hypothetical protein
VRTIFSGSLLRWFDTPAPRNSDGRERAGTRPYERESRWASIGEDENDDPDAALSQYADLVDSMLVENGYDVRDPVQRSGEEPEIVFSYLYARGVAERAEVGAASRDEARTAIDDLRAVFEAIVAERPE